MLKFFIWFCLLILGCTKPSPDWKNDDANSALLSSLLKDDSNVEENYEAPVVKSSVLKGHKKGVCPPCDKLPLDTDLKKAVSKHGKGDKRCGCCCCDCCDDCCCCGGGGGGGGGGCGCCDCDCCHGGDCCCCHDCCHGGGDCCCDDCCGCGCCSHDCHCHDHFHQNWIPACCCCCCNQNNNAADKLKTDKLKEKSAADAGVSAEKVELASEDSADAKSNDTDKESKLIGSPDKANLTNTEGAGNDTANATKADDDTPAKDTVILDPTEHAPANDTANTIKPAENNAGSGEEPADPTAAAIKTAVDAIKAQTMLKRRCHCDQTKCKKCNIVKDTRCKKKTNKAHVKSHCCCGCNDHCCQPCHHQCCTDHHHHHHHHHHNCCNNCNNCGANNNCCGSNTNDNCCNNNNNCCCGSNGNNNNCCNNGCNNNCGTNGCNNNCCNNGCNNDKNCGCGCAPKDCDDKKDKKD